MQRHELVFLKKTSTFTITTLPLSLNILTPEISAWITQGLPCVYTRQSSVLSEFMNLGVVLSIEKSSYRVGLRVHKNALQHSTSLPPLKNLNYLFKNALPVSPLMDDLQVLGSYMYEYFSKKSYIHDDSDLDLLIHYTNFSLAEISQTVNLLEENLTIVVDGEIRFPHIGDVAIKELLNRQDDSLLVKTVHTIKLFPRKVLYEYYPSLCSAAG